jgi:hypothetical protein
MGLLGSGLLLLGDLLLLYGLWLLREKLLIFCPLCPRLSCVCLWWVMNGLRI